MSALTFVGGMPRSCCYWCCHGNQTDAVGGDRWLVGCYWQCVIAMGTRIMLVGKERTFTHLTCQKQPTISWQLWNGCDPCLNSSKFSAIFKRFGLLEKKFTNRHILIKCCDVQKEKTIYMVIVYDLINYLLLMTALSTHGCSLLESAYLTTVFTACW